jgi:ADP-heptose:LPS heptosyltransferase
VKQQKLILANFQAPGDVVMLTAALRDLHACYPGRFLTDVQTSSPELWENNPLVTALDPADPQVRLILCRYPLIHLSNSRPVHFLHAFIEFLNERLGLQIKPTMFKGDIHLYHSEKEAPSPVEQIVKQDLPYWIIVAGGKRDFTIKWWHFRRWQAVVDHFRGRLLFAQVGTTEDYHPLLDGVLDLRDRTPIRELIRLVYHAQGVLCPVTLVMHLAAAVDTKPGCQPSRPCVVVAGGREPPSWEAYPTHQFLHTVGMLPCCATGGCWRSRAVPLGDGDEKDEPQHRCVDLVNNLPRCMQMITPEDVIHKIELYSQHHRFGMLTPDQQQKLSPFLSQRAMAAPFAGGRTCSRS